MATGTGSGTGTGTGMDTSSGVVPADAQPPLPEMLGIVGDESTLNLFVTKVPGEVFPGHSGQAGLITSDRRRISYWLGGDGGLCRLEAKLITSQEAINPDLPSDEANYRIAPEVKSLEFSYFDGTDWLDEWDSTAPGPTGDGVTPIGPPRAISIKIGFLPPPSADGTQETELKYLRHVIVIPTGGGPVQPTLTGAGTQP
jgi:hypothetical protein